MSAAATAAGAEEGGAQAAAAGAAASPRRSGVATGLRRSERCKADALHEHNSDLCLPADPMYCSCCLCSTARSCVFVTFTAFILRVCRGERQQAASPVGPQQQQPPPQQQQQQQASGSAAGASQRGAAMRADHLLNFQRYDVSSALGAAWRQRCEIAALCMPAILSKSRPWQRCGTSTT